LQREPQYSNNPLKIIMNHQFHLEGVGAQCTDCHRNISHDKLTPVTNRPRMEFCFQCHEANRETCSTCHTKGHLRPPRQAVARRSVCSKCHPRFEDKQIQIYGIEFSHRRHLAKAIDCNKCHSNVEKHGTIVRDRSECLECHHNRPLSECRRCHSLQRSFYSGRLRQFGFDRFEPNPMFGKVDCDGCHDLKGDHSVKAVSGRCVACHEEGYAELLKVQRTDIEGKLKAILADIGKLERRLGKGRRKDRRLREVESLLAGARKRVELVRKAGALHNPALATEILQQASRQVRRAQARF
jgi:ribosomal protein L31